MSSSVNASRMIALLAVLMAAIVALSGPVAEVLDLPSPTAEAKKKKKKPFPFNVVQCPTEGEDSFRCDGTAANDFLVGGPADREFDAFDEIEGGEGTDVYNGGDGSDGLVDFSTTSNDVYLFPSTEFSANFGGQSTEVEDEGGAGDIVALSSYGIDEFVASRDGDDLLLDGQGDRDIEIDDFFLEENKIEYFLFREGLVSGDEVASRAAARAAPKSRPR